jgi:DNA mismatch repair protein MutS
VDEPVERGSNEQTAGAAVTARPAWRFDAALGMRRLLAQLRVATLASWNMKTCRIARAASALVGCGR